MKRSNKKGNVQRSKLGNPIGRVRIGSNFQLKLNRSIGINTYFFMSCYETHVSISTNSVPAKVRPEPNLSLRSLPSDQFIIYLLQIAGIGQFLLGEGVDASGVATKILTCNCSIDLVTENDSKLFGLHIHPLLIEMSFGRLPFALSYVSNLKISFSLNGLEILVNGPSSSTISSSLNLIITWWKNRSKLSYEDVGEWCYTLYTLSSH
jgi:hypothetical protein